MEWRWRQLAEWRLRPIFAKGQRQCVHYLYPENSLFRGWKWKKQHGLILSCHQPSAAVAEGKRIGDQPFIEGLKHASKVVLLTESFRVGYEEFCDPSRLTVINHGVDVHFFCPSEQQPRKPLLITVGNWLRDYEFWADTVLLLAKQMPELQFAVVALPSVIGESFTRVRQQLQERVRLLHGIEDEDLKNLYRQATALFLPLKDAGANNALLEAMACGLPIVVSDFPVTREYAGDAGIFFDRRKIDECVMTLKSVLEDENVRDEFSTLVRRRAVARFSWEFIAAQYAGLYSEVLNQ